jgi:hypothetical protein
VRGGARLANVPALAEPQGKPGYADLSHDSRYHDNRDHNAPGGVQGEATGANLLGRIQD